MILLDVLLLLLVVDACVKLPRPLVTVRIAAGSEDLAFFQDPRVQSEFARHGFNVEVSGFGSREMARYVDPRKYDAMFPSGAVVAAEVENRFSFQYTEVVPFSTPLVVLSWRPLIPLLQTLRIATQAPDGTWIFHVARYLAVAGAGTRWRDIPGNNFYPNPNQVQLEMTDPSYSNSGAMFVAAASDVLNGGNVVSSRSGARSVGAKIAPILQALGFKPLTTYQVFQDYLTYGMNGTPLALGYESEFIGQKLARGELPQDAMIMYLDPTVKSDHTLIPRTRLGQQVANLLTTTDPTLRKLAESVYGFRSDYRIGTKTFAQYMASHGIQVPASPDFVPPPSAAILEEIINAIEP